MRLTEVPSRLSEISERYQVPERISAVSQKAYEGMTAAGEAARRGAHATYRLAREYPRTSIATLAIVATLVGGLLWYMFGNRRHPLERRQKVARVRARSERRSKHRAAQAAR